MARTRATTITPEQDTEQAPQVQPAQPAQDQLGNAAVNARLQGAGPREDISRYTPEYVAANRDALGIPPGAPVEDFFHEFVAHRLAYSDLSRQNPNDPNLSQADRERILAQRQMLESWGYNGNIGANQEVVDPNTGLYAVRLDPNEAGRAQGRNSVVAFRGTEPWTPGQSTGRNPWGAIQDGLSDFGPSVGSNQYNANAERIRALMAGGTGNVTTTGHSLGGYLAQRAAAENGDLTGQTVTFQAGGLNREDVARYNAANQDGHMAARHHYTTMDVVHRAGEERLPGTFFEHAPNGLTEGHTKYLMYDDNDVTTVAEATGGKTITQSNQDTVSPWSRHLWEGARTGAGGAVRAGMAPINAGYQLGYGLGNTAVNAVNGVGQSINNTWNGVAGGTATAWNGASTGLGQIGQGNILQGMGTMGSGLVQGTGQTLMGVGSGALGLARTGAGVVGDLAQTGWNAGSTLVGDTAVGAYQMARGGVNLAEGAVRGGVAATQWAGNQALNLGTSAVNGAVDLGSRAASGAANLGRSAMNGIGNAWNWAWGR